MSALPNALSVLRALLALPLVWALTAGSQGVALAVFALAVVSDVLDGRLARRLGRTRVVAAAGVGGDPGRRCGAFFDVGADAVFLLAGLTALWALGALLYVLLGLWLLGAPAGVRGAVLVVLVVATVASLLGRTLFLRRREVDTSRRWVP